jgi:hypothetical protein
MALTRILHTAKPSAPNPLELTANVGMIPTITPEMIINIVAVTF